MNRVIDQQLVVVIRAQGGHVEFRLNWQMFAVGVDCKLWVKHVQKFNIVA